MDHNERLEKEVHVTRGAARTGSKEALFLVAGKNSFQILAIDVKKLVLYLPFQMRRALYRRGG